MPFCSGHVSATIAAPVRPFSSDAQGGQKAIDREVPPFFGEGRHARKDRVDENSRDKRFRSAESIRQDPEEHSADGPAD